MRPLRLVSIALAAATAAAFARRHRRLAGVAPELRNPQLYVPMSLRGERSLEIGRKLMMARPPGVLADGVELRTEALPATTATDSVDVVVYEPSDRDTPSGALLWMHGGGLVMGSPEAGNELCSRFAAELGIVVVSVDYRLAPEHPFPAGLDDCYDALVWTHEQAEALSIDPERIAVGGDSAGGGLAACLSQLAIDRGGPSISFQLLQYPMLDDRTALRDDREAILWTNTSNRFAWSAYLGGTIDPADDRPYAAAARRDDLSGLPPAWIGIGAIDLFHDESAEYARRLGADGVEVELHVEPGMYHAAEQIVPTAPAMRAFRDRMVSALRTAMS